MSKDARTFKQLQNEKSFKELNRFAKEVTELYAKSDYVYSQKNVARDNNLSVKGLRDLMDYAITTNLVTIEIANKVLEKAIKTQQKKVAEAGGKSYSRHNELMRERNGYIAYSYLKVQIEEIAIDIAENFSQPISYFTKKYEIESDTITKLLLQRAIVENIISDKIVDKLIERTLKNDERESTKTYFDNILKARKMYN